MKTRSKFSIEFRQAIVRRKLGGEQVEALAKEIGVSRPTIYLWINGYRDELTADARRSNMSAPNIENADKRDLKIELASMARENIHLKQKLFEMMLETGRI